MVDSIAATSLLGHRPFNGIYNCKYVPNKRKLANSCQTSFKEFRCIKSFLCSSLPRWHAKQRKMPSIKAQAMELTKEAYSYREEDPIPRNFKYGIDSNVDKKQGLWPPENKADNPSLNNPLVRQERMGSGWLGAIFEWEGVLVEDNPDIEKQAWLALSQQEGKPPPPALALRMSKQYLKFSVGQGTPIK